jgi:hypothetical protein
MTPQDHQKAIAALIEVRDACLFSCDFVGIGVTEDPHIPSDLFDEICNIINESGL